jgi:GGDEF domain-containing protein
VNISEFRTQYPQYDDLNDDQLTVGLHQRYYSDVPREKFTQLFNPPEPTSNISEWSKALARGFLSEAPQMAGRAAQLVGEAPEGEDPWGSTLYEIGTSLRNVGKMYGDLPGLKAKPEGHGAVSQTITEGLEMIGPSVTPMALMAIPGMQGIAGLTLASGAGGALFGLSQAQDTLERGVEAGLTESEARSAAWKTGTIEALGETLGTAGLGLIFGTAGRIISKAAGKSTAQGVLEAYANPQVLKEFGKAMAKTYGIEIGTEIGQAAGQTAVERAAGITDTSPLEAAKHVIGPTAVMTSVLGMVGLPIQYQQRNLIRDTLADPESKPEERQKAASLVAASLKEVDPAYAKQWSVYAQNAIQTRKPIDLIKEAEAARKADKEPGKVAQDIFQQPTVDAAIDAATTAVTQPLELVPLEEEMPDPTRITDPETGESVLANPVDREIAELIQEDTTKPASGAKVKVPMSPEELSLTPARRKAAEKMGIALTETQENAAGRSLETKQITQPEPAGATLPEPVPAPIPETESTIPKRERTPRGEIIALDETQADILRNMANQAGWSEVGGKLQRERRDDDGPNEATGPVIGRTTWVPYAPWWADFRRDKTVRMKPEQLQAAVEKAAAGEPLSAREARAVRWLADESVRNPEIEQYEDAAYAEDTAWLTEDQDPVFLEPGEEREALDLMHAGLQMGLDSDTIRDIVERAAIQEISDEDILERFESAVAQRRANESPALVSPATEKRVQAETPTGQVETDLFGAAPVTAQTLADKQLEVDQKLGKGREHVPAESAGDIFDENRGKQVDIEDQQNVTRGELVKVKHEVPAKTESELIAAGLIQPGASKLAARAGRWQYRDEKGGLATVKSKAEAITQANAVLVKQAAAPETQPVAQMEVEFRGKRYPVESFADAQDKWDQFREQTGAGASSIGDGAKVYLDGKEVARISYNGRMWETVEGRVDEDRREIRTKPDQEIKIGKNSEGQDIYEGGDGTRYLKDGFMGPRTIEGGTDNPLLITNAETKESAALPSRRDDVQRTIYDRRLEDITDPAELRAYAEELRTALMTDERTGLGSNRAWLGRAPKENIASVDLDSLKWVNDNMGHDAGDRLIAVMGDAFRDAGVGGDAFHVSGDEFYVHYDNVGELQQAMELAQDYLRGVTITGNGLNYTGPGFSFGIGTTIEQAEAALYDNKNTREEAGQRTTRGERPQGVIEAAQAPEPERVIGDRAKTTATREGTGGERPGSDLAPADPITTAANKLSESADKLTAAADKIANIGQPAEKPAKQTNKIDDFGEVLQGAKKHTYAQRLADAKGVDISARPLSESWPEPDYQQLIDEGASPWSVAFVRAARDEIPVKPKKSWKLKQWAEQVSGLRDMSERLLSGEVTAQQVRTLLGRNEYRNVADTVSGRADLYAAVGHEKSLKGLRVSMGEYSVYAGEKFSTPKVIWAVEKAARKTAFSNMPSMIVKGDTRAEAIEKFKKVYAGMEAGPESSKTVRFDIYSTRGDTADPYFIGKKIGKRVVQLKRFASIKEAREYKAAHQAELEAMLDQYKDIPSERKDTNSPRVGIDHRNGADVTPEQFSEAFGFKGVQFGNWVEGGKRQQDLNNAYDALMDLAGILDIPSKALSLNGELGLAFGARGSGGKGAGGSAAAAHYESDTVVINLTKKAGAGSLAHEWWHSLDNYFSRMRQDKEGFVTEKPYFRGEGVRPEMVDAFKTVTQAVNKTRLKQRSGMLERKAKDYWTTGREMTARSFESYVIAKLQDQGLSNDYLANIVSQDYWDAAAALGMELEGSYPYPEAAEVQVIREGFDHFFNTVETRETDRGVEMFSLRRDVTETSNFKDWFGKSKVVDGQGRPLVVYHGTTRDIEAFSGKLRGGLGGVMGHWFASDPAAVEPFQRVRVPSEDRPATVPVYLSLQNPKEYDGWSAFVSAGNERKGSSIEARMKSLRNSLIRAGHDGIVIRSSTTDSGVKRDDFVAFSPTQIKSATGNRGTFDPANPDIRFALRPEFARVAVNVVEDLKARLKQVGMSDKVALNLKTRIQAMADGKASEADGRYVRGFIEIAMQAPNAPWTMNHEIIHALKDMGLLRAAEWRTLEKAAKADTDRMAGVRERYDGLGLSEEAMVEEAVADMFADWKDGRTKAGGFLRTAFERIRNFFRALGNALRGNGFQSADDVFQRVERGEVGTRTGETARDPQGRFMAAQRQTNTKAFRDWFKGSKVVDEQGLPLVVYHGTTADVTVFDPTKAGSSGIARPDKKNKLVWFTSLSEEASVYAKSVLPRGWQDKLKSQKELWQAGDNEFYDEGYMEWVSANQGSGVSVFPVYIKIENPMIIDAKGRPSTFKNYASIFSKSEHDGLIIKNANGLGYDGTYYAVRFPEQIKSATGNRGTFDPANPDIRFAMSDSRVTSLMDRLEKKQRPEQRQKMEALRVNAVVDEMYRAGVNERKIETYINEAVEPAMAPLRERADVVKDDLTDSQLIDRLKDEMAPVLDKELPNLPGTGMEKLNGLLQQTTRMTREFSPWIFDDSGIERTNGEVVPIRERFALRAGDFRPVQQPEPDNPNILFSMKDRDQQGLRNTSMGALDNDPSSQEAQEVQSGVEGKSAIEAADFIRKNAPSSDYRLIAFRVANQLRRMEKSGLSFDFKVAHLGEPVHAQLAGKMKGMTWRAYDSTKTDIWVQGADVTGIVGTSYETVLHELLHAVTQSAIYIGGQPGKTELHKNIADLEDVHKEIAGYLTERINAAAGDFNKLERIERVVAQGHNAMEDTGELVSWALTNRAMQDYLESIPYKGGTLWSRFVTAIRKFLGLPERAETALSEILRITDRLLDTPVQPLLSLGEAPTQINYTGGLLNTSLESRDPPYVRRLRERQEAIETQESGQPPTQPNSTEPTSRGYAEIFRRATRRLDPIRYVLQDKYIDLKHIQSDLGVTEAEDAYLRESIWLGRAGERLERFEEDRIQPLLQKGADTGLEMDQIDRWLHARHAQEANTYLKRINPDRADNTDLSGMSDTDAAAILGQHTGNQALQDVGTLIDQINQERVQIMLNTGLITQEEVDAWNKTYSKYVPLKREEAKTLLPPRGQGFNIRGKESRQRTGSHKAVTNVLTNVIAQYEATVIRSEKNRVGQAFLEFAKNTQNSGLWTVDTQKRQPAVVNGEVRMVSDPREYDNEFKVKVEGVGHTVTFNESSPEAMRIAKAMKNLDHGDMGKLTRFLLGVNRILATLNTSLSPEFVISNFARDIQTAVYNMTDTELVGVETQVIKMVPGALKGLYQNLRQGRTDTDWAGWAERFRKAGGKTGWLDHYKDVLDRQHKLGKEMERMRAEKGKGAIFAAARFVSDYNTIVENGVRLAAFRKAVELGATDDAAASLAKNLTVNFNRKGTAGPMMNALYLFYNASIQGQIRMLQALAYSKKGRALAVGTIGFAVMLDIFNRSMSGDDDDGENLYDNIQAYEKARNLIVMGEKQPVFKFPLPWGYNVLHVIGQQFGDMLTGERFDASKSAAKTASAFADAFNPVGSGTVLQAFSPTIIDPAVQIGENKIWTGAPLKPEASPFGVPKPEYQQHWSNSREVSKSITKWLNDMSGGDEVRPGTINLSPEWMDVLVDFSTGSAGRVVADSFNIAHKAVTGEEITLKEVPMARKLYGYDTSRALQSRYYEWSDDVQYTAKQVKELRGSEQLKAKGSPEAKLIGMEKLTRSRLAKLRKQKRLAENSGNKDRVEQIEAQMRLAMARFNQRYVELVLQ